MLSCAFVPEGNQMVSTIELYVNKQSFYETPKFLNLPPLIKAAEELELLSSDSANSTLARQKRQAPEFLTILRQTRCPLLLVADYR